MSDASPVIEQLGRGLMWTAVGLAGLLLVLGAILVWAVYRVEILRQRLERRRRRRSNQE